MAVPIAITGVAGLPGLEYKPYMRSVSVPQPDVDIVVVSILDAPANNPTQTLLGTMTVLHIDQSHTSLHPKNDAVATMVGPEFEPWFGNVLVVACNSDGSCFHNMDNVEVARQCVMSYVATPSSIGFLKTI